MTETSESDKCVYRIASFFCIVSGIIFFFLFIREKDTNNSGSS